MKFLKLHLQQQQQKHKLLWNKLTKDLYTKTHKSLLREIKGGLNKMRDIPRTWVGGFNIVDIHFPQIDS